MDYYADNNVNLNEEYLREMEKNAQLFEQKMQKLNRFQFNETNDNISLQPTNQHNQMQLQSQYSNPNNFTFKPTSLDNQQQPFNQQGSNTKLIEQLQNEISYKEKRTSTLLMSLDCRQTHYFVPKANKKFLRKWTYPQFFCQTCNVLYHFDVFALASIVK